jgi:hypothetical protein
VAIAVGGACCDGWISARVSSQSGDGIPDVTAAYGVQPARISGVSVSMAQREDCPVAI